MSERHDFDLAATIVRGQAPARAVTVQRAVAFSGRLTHQLDYVVFLHVLFAINGGLQVTVPGIVSSVREAGVRSAKSGTELVGRDAVYESFTRLIEARFIRRTTIPNPKGKGFRGLTSYEVYEHFEDNPDYSAETAAEPSGTKLPVFAETPVSAGQSTSGVRGNKGSSGVRGTGVRGRGGSFVSAGQPTSANTGSGKGSPPHPPEEVNTSSPYPLGTGAAGEAPAARKGEEEIPTPPTPSAEEVEAAFQFLQELPRPWTAGRVTAKALAPLLAGVVADQGWELNDLLVKELTQNPEGVKRPTKVLKSRIEDLPRRLARKDVPRPRPAVAEEPDFVPVPMPHKVASILTGLRKPAV
ncbi:hypothetical protein [Streptomyces antarcticus]|uniref:hypothetical protein n=1 Tax=Streptomyces antarcticus TaxID=2996458 RepID=UPI00226F354F|nr:hypothetical protein [Streptomyces sp. H34-AA3]MCY0946311.1 hypothetical protein [Streptomyces sp. H34-AA3]